MTPAASRVVLEMTPAVLCSLSVALTVPTRSSAEDTVWTWAVMMNRMEAQIMRTWSAPGSVHFHGFECVDVLLCVPSSHHTQTQLYILY